MISGVAVAVARPLRTKLAFSSSLVVQGYFINPVYSIVRRYFWRLIFLMFVFVTKHSLYILRVRYGKRDLAKEKKEDSPTCLVVDFLNRDREVLKLLLTRP